MMLYLSRVVNAGFLFIIHSINCNVHYINEATKAILTENRLAYPYTLSQRLATGRVRYTSCKPIMHHKNKCPTYVCNLHFLSGRR